jgi:hypothetical protein
MAIKDWHWGQLIVLWAGALLVEMFAAGMSVSLDRHGPLWVVQAAMIYALPFVMLCITWVWFGARPRR